MLSGRKRLNLNPLPGKKSKSTQSYPPSNDRHQRSWLFNVRSCFVVHLLLVIVHRPDPVRSTTEEVDIDLLHGIVKGYSNHISFLASPSPAPDRSCSARAVVRIDFSGLYNRARLTLDYDKPKLWTLDVSDSITGDGYGGDNGTTSNMAETQIFNRQLRIYGNSLPGYLDAVIDGGLLLKVYFV